MMLGSVAGCSDGRGCAGRSETSESPGSPPAAPFDGGMVPRVITPDGATALAPPPPEGPPPAECSGRALDFAAVVNDPRCKVGARRAKALRAALEADGGAALRALRQVARPAEGGGLEVAVTNAGATALVLPLSWHRELPAFTALAEDTRHGQVFELEPPRLDDAEALDAGAGDGSAPGDAGDAGATDLHPTFAQIELSPGGSIKGVVRISPRIVRRLAPSCPDGGTCAPARLAPGPYTLHLGELLLDVEAGPPARLPWTVTEVLP